MRPRPPYTLGSSMNRTRLIAITKLVLLFGTPLALLVGLFGSGVYCGVQNRTQITQFEHDWLGLDVEVPADEGAEPAETKEPAESSEPDPEKTPEPEPEPKEPTEPEPKPTTPAPEVKPAVVDPPAPTPQPDVVVPQPPVASKVDPLPAPERERFDAAAVVQVKILVDSSFVAARPNWIDEVQRTVSQASQVYEDQFGIRLEVWGVARWTVAPEGMSTDDLLEDLRGRSREGAEILIGFTDRPYDGVVATSASPTSPDDPFNGAYGVVYATAGHRQAHLRSLLHTVGRMYGAVDITDAESAAWRAGSFMSYAPVPETQAPWIDADNRRRVLERKDRPFAPEGTPPQEVSP